MARSDPPIYKTKVKRDEVREAKKGDIEKFENDEAWQLHARLEHPELFKPVSYSQGSCGAYYSR